MPTGRLIVMLLAASTPWSASAEGLVPHRAVYDLSLAEQSRDLVGVEARIALDLTVDGCETYDLDYRFVARFGDTAETTLTDQRITAQEAQDGSSYAFTALSLLDGTEQSRAEGSAATSADATTVEMAAPVARRFELPRSHFPLGHTLHLIERARAGQRIVESPLYDGDIEGENLLTTTAVISPVPDTAERPAELSGLEAWRVDESYFTETGSADGLPSFHTRYTLYENGVSDALFMDFGDYALEGGLTELTLGERPADCPA